MAYIAKKYRLKIDTSLVGNCELSSQDHLSYAILKLVYQYAGDNDQNLVDAVGVLESAKQELYRKHINPLTAQKEFDHGEDHL